jgi:SAM-dependent methyltransferase
MPTATTGPGIVARQFQAAGCRVLGVDPDARMADLARRHGRRRRRGGRFTVHYTTVAVTAARTGTGPAETP